MATIEKRSSKDNKTSYRAKIRLKGHPIQSATFTKLTDAKNWVQITEAAIKEGRYFKGSEAKKRTLSELVDRYIVEVLPHKKSIIIQEPQLLWWKSHIGDYFLSDITSGLLISYRSILFAKEGIKASATVNRYFSALSHVFTIGVKEWEWMEENPILKISKLKEGKGRTRFLADDERRRLINISKESKYPYLYVLVMLSLSTGARKMELCSLKWDDIDLNRGTIILHDTKNKDKRSLPLVGIAQELMREFKEKYYLTNQKVLNNNSNLVFPSNTNINKPVDINYAFKIALQEASISDFRWHDLRHSCASYLAMNGASLVEIAAILGHKTLDMVKRYAHLSDVHTASVVERMSKKVLGGI